jgi:hypothetical protein
LRGGNLEKTAELLRTDDLVPSVQQLREGPDIQRQPEYDNIGNSTRLHWHPSFTTLWMDRIVSTDLYLVNYL